MADLADLGHFADVDLLDLVIEEMARDREAAEARWHALSPDLRARVDERLDARLRDGIRWDTYPGVLDSIIDDVEAGQ